MIAASANHAILLNRSAPYQTYAIQAPMSSGEEKEAIVVADATIEEESEDDGLDPIKLQGFPPQNAMVFDLAFHSTKPLIGMGLLSGCIQLYQYTPPAAIYNGSDDTVELIHSIVLDEKVDFTKLASVRCVMFDEYNDKIMFAASSHHLIYTIDITTGKILCVNTPVEGSSHAHPISAMCQVDEGRILTGDDDGRICMWNVSKNRKAMTMEYAVYESSDFITGLAILKAERKFVVTSGDGFLYVHNIKTGKLHEISFPTKDDMLSLLILANGKRIICGTKQGHVNLYKLPDIDTFVARLTGHPACINTLVKVNEHCFLSGAEDGIIRFCQIAPQQILGAIGQHGQFPTERLCLSQFHGVLASVSHDSQVKLWDVRYLFDEPEEEKFFSDDEDTGQDEPAPVTATTKAPTATSSSTSSSSVSSSSSSSSSSSTSSSSTSSSKPQVITVKRQRGPSLKSKITGKLFEPPTVIVEEEEDSDDLTRTQRNKRRKKARKNNDAILRGGDGNFFAGM